MPLLLLRVAIVNWGSKEFWYNFVHLADGQAALDNQIQLNVNRGWTLQDFFNSYAPAASGNNPGVYTQNVASWTGLDPNVPLNSYDPSLLLAGAGYSTVDATGTQVASLLGGDTSGMNWGMIGLGLLAVYAISRIF